MKKLHAITWKEEKWFVAKALEVEVASQGNTKKEALKNLEEALELYFEDEDDVNFSPAKAPKIQNLSINLHA